MAYWLMKSEPSAWSWSQQVAKGALGEPWTGVRNHLAKRHLMAMRCGDLAYFYHSVDEKAVVGVVEVVREHYVDPTDPKGSFVAVDVVARDALPLPVSLAAIKAHSDLQNMALIKQSRLSVQPVSEHEWLVIAKLGGLH